MAYHVSPHELKFREIFDFLESGQNKSAIKNCVALIQKNKRVHLARVLKAIALDRMGKEEEALIECDLVQKEVPVDEDILRKLLYVYKSAKRIDLATAAYEAAFEKQPTESLANSVFLSYVRQFRFSDQRTFAFKLMKMYPKKSQYYFYAAVSFIQQIPKDEMKPTNINLTLASRTVDKIENQFGFSTIEAVLFAMNLNDLLDKNEETFALLEKYRTVFKRNEDFVEAKARLHMKLKQFNEAKILYRELMVDMKQDNWNFFQSFLECQLHDGVMTLEKAAEARSLLASIKEQKEIHQRCVLLGYIDINVKLYLADNSGENGAQVKESLSTYLNVFGHKQVCFRDVRFYMKELPLSLVQEVISIFAASFPKEVSETITLKEIYRKVLLEQLKAKYQKNADATEDETRALIEEYIVYYSKALGIPSAAGLVETERQYGDDLIVLAVHLYIDLFFKTDSYQFLIEALVLLATALEKSKFNFHLKIIAMRLYCLLGALRPCYDLYTTLECKHIQMDTFSHVILHDSLALGVGVATEGLVFAMERFYTDSLREMPELVTYPYVRESYSRAREFREFNDKISNTVQRATHNVEYGLYDLFTFPSTPAESLKKLQEAGASVLYKPEDISALYQSADNSFWDEWHSISELSSPYVTNGATTRLNDKERTTLVQARGMMYHLILFILQNEPEMVKDLLEQLRGAYERIPFDKESLVLWDQILLLFQMFSLLLSSASLVKDNSITKEQIIGTLEAIQSVEDSFNAVALNLKEKTENAFVASLTMPLYTMFTTTLCWCHLLLAGNSSIFPNRVKKTSTAETKEAFRDIRKRIREFTPSLVVFIDNVAETLNEFATKEYKADESISLSSICEKASLESVCLSITQSSQASYSELAKKIKSVSLVKK